MRVFIAAHAIKNLETQTHIRPVFIKVLIGITVRLWLCYLFNPFAPFIYAVVNSDPTKYTLICISYKMICQFRK